MIRHPVQSIAQWTERQKSWIVFQNVNQQSRKIQNGPMVLANLAMTVETPRILLREMIGDGIGVGLETGKVEVARERVGEMQRGIGTSGIEIEAPAETDNTHAE